MVWRQPWCGVARLLDLMPPALRNEERLARPENRFHTRGWQPAADIKRAVVAPARCSVDRCGTECLGCRRRPETDALGAEDNDEEVVRRVVVHVARNRSAAAWPCACWPAQKLPANRCCCSMRDARGQT